LTVAEPLEIAEVHGFVGEATQAVRTIEETMMNRGGGSHAVPQLDTLLQVLQHMQQMLEPFVRQPTAAAESGVTQSPNTAVSTLSSTAPLEEIVSREDVLRALDAVMSYYRNHEPGSLVPTIAERAKRLVSMSFFEALAEVAPDVVDPVKKAVGVREPF
jgi:type VI secretion system protein ImpA